MDEILLAPPAAFVIYLALTGLLSGLGRVMAGPGQASPEKASTYASGEEAPTTAAVPGYRPFFVVALFFAVLHLGVLVLGSTSIDSDLGSVTGIYLAGLILALLALILG